MPRERIDPIGKAIYEKLFPGRRIEDHPRPAWAARTAAVGFPELAPAGDAGRDASHPSGQSRAKKR